MLVSATVVSRSGWTSADKHWIHAKCRVSTGQWEGTLLDVYYSKLYKRELTPSFELGSVIKLVLKFDDVGYIKKAEVPRIMRDRRIK